MLTMPVERIRTPVLQEFAMSNASIMIRLSIMMFLQFFIWGAWYVTAPNYLGIIGFGGADFGWTYSVGPIAGMISPFFIGFVADRYFATERVLGLMHLLGAGFMYYATTLMQTDSPSPSAINWALFGHMLCFYPTLSLTNSLSMHNLTDTEKQFPLVRVFGTIGWIVAGIVVAFAYRFGFSNWDRDVNMFYAAIGVAVILGLYSFTLPHTPPPARGKKASFKELAGLDALGMFRNRSFLIFMFCSFAICIPLAFYYQLAQRAVEQAGIADPAFKMTFGQMSEIFFMVVMPFFFVRLGVKWMLAVGMLAWVVRYALFAIGSPVGGEPPSGIAWMMLTGVILHGICYDFFFVTGQIYTDKVAPTAVRAQAQGLLVFFTLGLGMFIGAQIGGQVEARYTPEESLRYTQQAEFRGDLVSALKADPDAPETEQALDSLRSDENEELTAEQIAALASAYRSRPDSEATLAAIESAEQLQAEFAMKALQTKNWQTIWALPAVAALVVLLIFLALFRIDADVERESIEAVT
jgi:nucleoside transporter